MSDSNTDTGDTIRSNNTEFNSSINSSSTSVPPREALITTCVGFLQNAKVRPSTLMQKQQYLRSKGLTDEEIQIACERAGVFSRDPNGTVINMGISTLGREHPGYMNHNQIVQKQGTMGHIKEALQSMALISGLAYAVYLFYKVYPRLK